MKTHFEGNHIRVTTHESRYGLYETVHTKTGKFASVLALSNNHVLLVEQFREPVQKYTWELPGGAVDEGEDFITGGLRELAEETGVVADPANTVEFLTGFNAPATINEQGHILITVLPDDYPKAHVNFQVSELSDARWFPLDDVIGLAKENRLSSFITAAAIMKLVLFGVPENVKR